MHSIFWEANDFMTRRCTNHSSFTKSFFLIILLSIIFKIWFTLIHALESLAHIKEERENMNQTIVGKPKPPKPDAVFVEENILYTYMMWCWGDILTHTLFANGSMHGDLVKYIKPNHEQWMNRAQSVVVLFVIARVFTGEICRPIGIIYFFTKQYLISQSCDHRLVLYQPRWITCMIRGQCMENMIQCWWDRKIISSTPTNT